ncbi:MAG: APC family permease [Anaerolineae bacterium]|nr:APC family permease [Anaerolineae bacterium]
MALRSYIDPAENREASRKLPKLMVEGLLLGGTGLGVFALIFEIAADAFSVAAYQTLLAIHGASGHHDIAILAFILLSAMLFLGIVPAYKAGAYIRPTAGGSGPLVEAIGPPKLRWLSWVGTSLFFLDAVLTIIISSISAADVLMLKFPEFAPYRILLAECFAFFIMAVLVAVGPRRAVPLFLLGGGAFTIFTLLALSLVGYSAVANPEWAFLTSGIIHRLEEAQVVEHVVRAAGDAPAIGSVLFFQFFFRSMSSAMLGFSGYEVIPASGKHAARPKWKVVNTALTLAAVFLIGTGVLQLAAAKLWNIPSTEGYSTLLIEYEIVAAQTFGRGVVQADVIVADQDAAAAERIYEERQQRAQDHNAAESGAVAGDHSRENDVGAIANDIAIARAIESALRGSDGQSILSIAALLLAIILLLAQGGGYVGGAAVAANAAKLGRLPGFFTNDRIGIAVIWGFSAAFIPLIREVVVVEAYYAFGFVSAFIITSTTVCFARDDVLRDRGITPGSAEARSLRFAGFRGMLASYAMGIVLITQKTDALGAIVVLAVLITLFQLYYAFGGARRDPAKLSAYTPAPDGKPDYHSGIQRAHDKARARGIIDRVNQLLEEGAVVKFNVDSARIRRLVTYVYCLDKDAFELQRMEAEYDDDIAHEPSKELDDTYFKTFNARDEIIAKIESYSHYGIFTFIDKYYANWVNEEHGRNGADVQRSMISLIFPLTDDDLIFEQFQQYKWEQQPEEIWQFCRERYSWAKDQWPNLSGRLTTVWTLQELGLIPDEVDIKTIISVNARNDLREIKIHTHGPFEQAPADGSPAPADGDTEAGDD